LSKNKRVGFFYEKPTKKPPKHPKGSCKYCGKPLTGFQRKWCKPHHGHLYWLHYKSKKIFWSDWKKKVLIRDKYTCQEPGCGSKEDLDVHHILPISLGGKEFDEDNCITLCNPCHKKKHRRKPRAISKSQTSLSEYVDGFIDLIFEK